MPRGDAVQIRSDTNAMASTHRPVLQEPIPLYRPLLHKYFLPAAVTLCLNTGLPILPSVVENGFIIAFNQTSNTSPKNCRIASSVCGLVGLFGMLVLLDDEAPRLAAPVESGTEV